MRLKPSLIPWLLLALLLTALAASWFSGGIVAELTQPDLTAAERVARLQDYFRSAGALAPVLYVVFVIAEVTIAPIPGLMLYAPGGLIFGPWLGGFLAIVGNMIGAGISCGLTRSLGHRWLDRIAGHQSIEKLQQGLNRRGFWMIVVLRLNPLTSTDLLSYAAGFTRMPIHQVVLATGLGMTPLCLAQSWLSDSIFNRWPQLLWPMLAAGIIYLFAVVAVLAKLCRQTQAVVAPVETDR
jgi:uncharacterized membrane protein YdjX (TVP38/TMEM64 family)